VEWGAEKLGHKCPDCENEELVPAGQSEEKVVRRTTLKRKPRRPLPSAHVAESEIIVPDIEEIEAEEVEVEFEREDTAAAVFLAPDDEGAHVGLDLEDVVPVDDLAEADSTELALGEDLPFSDTTPPLGGEGIDDAVVETDEWSK
jgi:hypothetical protein